MFSLLFSTKGRIKRLPYFGLSVAVFIVMIMAIFFLATSIIPDGMEGSAAELTALLTAEPVYAFMIVGLYLLGSWVQICLVFKRNRDFSDNTTFAKLYTLFLLPSAILPFIYGILFVMGLVLLFRPSKPGQIDEQPAAVFGERFRSAPQPDASIGISGDTDLIARAAQLRESEQTRATASQAAKPTGRRVANAGFGQRTNAPAFGNR